MGRVRGGVGEDWVGTYIGAGDRTQVSHRRENTLSNVLALGPGSLIYQKRL